MSTPTRGAASGTTQIEVDWLALSSAPSNGGSTITSYNLQWDAGTSGSTWSNLNGYSPSSLSLSYIVTTGLASGNSY
jgi:hypothetical protein